MKKIKFLAMALAALTVFSCSKDEAKNNGGTPPVVEGVETYATFNFNIEGAKPAGPTTKAVGDTETDNGKTERDEKAIKNVRIVIFNDADKLEIDQKIEITNATPA
ncbi:MAG: fimbrial protein, partial [Rikenellaceae bacterium]